MRHGHFQYISWFLYILDTENKAWLKWRRKLISLPLTHWGQVEYICVGKLDITGSYNGLSPGQHQAIIWTIAGILLIWPKIMVLLSMAYLHVGWQCLPSCHLSGHSGQDKHSIFGHNSTHGLCSLFKDQFAGEFGRLRTDHFFWNVTVVSNKTAPHDLSCFKCIFSTLRWNGDYS